MRTVLGILILAAFAPMLVVAEEPPPVSEATEECLGCHELHSTTPELPI